MSGSTKASSTRRRHVTRSAGPQSDYAEAHYDRADLKTFVAGDADLAAMESLAADPGRLPPGKMLYIHFALGKALEDIGDDPRASSIGSKAMR